MKITIKQSELARALKSATRVVPSRVSIPVLGMFKFEVNKKSMRVIATNLDVQLSLKIPCEAEEKAEFLIDGARLNDAVGQMAGGDVDMDINMTPGAGKSPVAKVKGADGFRCNFPVMPVDEYPSKMEFKDESTPFSVPASSFRNAISKTAYAVSNDMGRPSLWGVSIAVVGKHLEFVATDGHTLSKQRIEDVGKTNFPMSILNPRAADVLFSCMDFNDELELSATASVIRMRFSDGEVYARLIDGPFPRFEGIIPTTYTGAVRVNRMELEVLARQVASMANRVTKAVNITIGSGKVVVDSENVELGVSGSNAMKGKCVGASIETAVQGHFLLEVLKLSGGQEIDVKYNTTLAPIVFQYPGIEDKPTLTNNPSGELFIIMPIRKSATKKVEE